MTMTPMILAIPQEAPLRSPRQVRLQRHYARLALAHCAKRCNAPTEGWIKDARESPLPNAGFHWSISHKPQWAVAIIADRPVGIDIEHIAPRKRELHDALADDAEWAIMADRSWPAFFRLWTAKEATLKANATGIAGFSKCRLTSVPDAERMTLHYAGHDWEIEHYYHCEHVIAVTANAERVEWCVL